MKHVCTLAVVLAIILLAGCNQPNNGEIPPAGELPTPYTAQNSSTTTSTTPSSGATASPSTTSTSTNASAATPQKTATAKSVASGPYQYDPAKGKALFADNCAACHQTTGLGIPGAFPPLKGNPVVANADPTVQIQTILHGKHGVAIDGKTWSGVMIPFASSLDDVDIANIANYERSSWGNHGKHITPAEVAKVRAGGKAG